MAEPARQPPRQKTKLGVIARLGERLSSDERAPYERVEHEDALLFDEPTGDQLVPADRSSEGGGKGGTRGGKGEP
ncbi:MAG: hypothetical protein A2138_14525 [Deltaproteobacteria bacterium RBG_16_71_12]|nr:MAG: hypothetical protein A2138_14525 [Deltaproteobacteria bacterium RBG_16_71_12]